MRAVALAVLCDDRIAHVNPICHYLGDGTSESAINNIVVNNVELTDTPRYDRWLETRLSPREADGRQRSSVEQSA